MRLCFFNEGRLGLVRGDVVHDVSDALDVLPAARYPFPRHDLLIERLPELRQRIDAVAGTRTVPVAAARFQSPVANPGKIVAAPVNYRKHLEEAIAEPETFSRAHVRQIQETGLFLKATSSLIGASEPVRIRHADRRTDHEVELAVIIGQRCKGVSRTAALDYVAGYCIGLDITVRGPEERSLRKSLDSYTVLGPCLVTADELGEPAGLDLALTVNGESRQMANTRDLILDVPALIEFASSFYTLEPGDVLLTGTPEGVGPIRPGDEMHARIDRLGEMRVRVELEAEGGAA
ncbi:fumarylacetoacetate hydrolase family protein [Roseomonas sp. NAR14]|uniref:Fumarylacetoacetate hydrolase family protein n=1 Tax=Roseomonas acroporae TaxID=2937791 RepID=A0A9X2BUZ0_9PROT|nr:fumarylacetoacetate hydrolase family protein [Roseomonas acroporae]MCK8786087.1 fumarylacetoacetate hydrolase family protein [Roseomonas acroporae]